MSDQPPSLPRARKPLEGWFWAVLFLPVLFVILTVVMNKSAEMVVPLILLGLSALICPVFCGFRLAFLWSQQPATRVLLGVGLTVGLGCLYLAVSFAGCMTIL
jgi:hypothetical protein